MKNQPQCVCLVGHTQERKTGNTYEEQHQIHAKCKMTSVHIFSFFTLFVCHLSYSEVKLLYRHHKTKHSNMFFISTTARVIALFTEAISHDIISCASQLIIETCMSSSASNGTFMSSQTNKKNSRFYWYHPSSPLMNVDIFKFPFGYA